MAKARTKKAIAEAKPPEQPPTAEPLDPKKIHELLGLHGPYEPPPPPVLTKDYVTWWDPGISIRDLVRKQRALFYLKDHDGAFAKQTDSWKWRQIRLTPIEPELTFAEQAKKLKTGDEPAAARAGNVPRPALPHNRRAVRDGPLAVQGRVRVRPPGHRGSVQSARSRHRECLG
jgi:hypothetical protein